VIDNREKIYSPEEQEERAAKALSLNGDSDYNYRLLAAASPIKPTLRVKRLDFRPIEEREKEKAEKAPRLNGG
jgi:hypothetical protein